MSAEELTQLFEDLTTLLNQTATTETNYKKVEIHTTIEVIEYSNGKITSQKKFEQHISQECKRG